MNSTEILSVDDLHKLILNGVKIVCNTVTATMGANGKNVIIEEPNGFCRVTKDGVSVAKSINLPNKFENMGARLVIDASISTVEEVGDGTTTTVLLASNIYEKAMIQIQRGYSHRKIVDQINYEKQICLEILNKYKIDSSSEEDLIRVATTSANNNRKIGEFVGELWYKVGKNGIIDLSRSENGETSSKIYDGLVIGSGYVSKLFTNSGNKSILDDCYVLVTNYDINSATDIIDVLQFVANSDKRKLFIMAKSFSNDAVASLLANKRQGTFDICIAETSTFPDWDGIDEDLAIVTGAHFIDKRDEIGLLEIADEHLGSAKNVTSTINKITVVPHTKSERYDDWIKSLNGDIDERRTEIYKNKLRTRIARLEGKIATIFVGGHTETEHNYMFDMFDDSVKATKNCLTSGITVGGGTIYMALSKSLSENATNIKTNSFFSLLKNIIRIKQNDSILGSSLEKPLEKLLQNSGYDDNFIKNIKQNIMESSDFKQGFNLLSETDVLEDLYKSGVIEPLGLIENCIKNSCSVANLLISTHSGISIIPESLI